MGIILSIYRGKEIAMRFLRKQLFIEYLKYFGMPVKQIKGLIVDRNVNFKAQNVKLGGHVHIYDNVTFWGNGEIIIGNNVKIGSFSTFFSGEGIIIGDNTNIAAQCYIIDADHGIEKDRLIREQEDVVEKIVIGRDVWVGAGVVILKGSIIEDGAVIGAGAVVKGHIPKNAVVAGIPARVIKYRQSEMK